MKYYRYLTAVLLVLLVMGLTVSDGGAAPQSYPDLLSEDLTATDYLDEPVEVTINDPLEPMNRAFFLFNDKLYEWVLKPVTNVYIWVLPLELRECFNNFFLNMAMPINLVNSLLQWNLEASGIVLERFLINSTVGIVGFGDIADKEFGIKPRRADFGQTLGKWGLGEGVYFCWPVFGPSSIRDTAGLIVDGYTSFVPYFDSSTRVFNISYYTTNMINRLSLHPTAYDDLKKYSVDPYVASRQAYYEYRRSVIGPK